MVSYEIASDTDGERTAREERKQREKIDVSILEITIPIFSVYFCTWKSSLYYTEY